MGQKCGGHYYNTEAYTGTIEGSLRVKQAELETNLREVGSFTITEKALTMLDTSKGLLRDCET